MKRNDQLWKAALEDLFDDFLRFFYSDADQLFDMERGFEYLDKELDQLFPPSSDHSAIRYVDKLVKVFSKNGEEEWILIHIEVQGYTDQNFAKRMFQYYYRILDMYDKPITAFAIFADNAKKFHPKYYERAFLGTRLYYVYNTYKIIDQDDDALQASNNPFAMAVLSAKLALGQQPVTDEQLFERAYDLAKRLLGKQIPKEKIRKLMIFLRHYVRFENPEMIVKFEEEIGKLTERKIAVGIEEFVIEHYKKEAHLEGMAEGMAEGIAEGMAEGIERGIRKTALKMKNSGLEIGVIADVTGLSVKEIEGLTDVF